MVLKGCFNTAYSSCILDDTKAPGNSARSVKFRASDGKNAYCGDRTQPVINTSSFPECGWFYLQAKPGLRSHMEEEAVRL